MKQPVKNKKEKPIIVGQVPSQMKGNKWYQGNDKNIMELESLLLGFKNQTPVSYFKIEYGSHASRKQNLQFWKTISNGYMVYVDVTNMKMGIVQGFGVNRKVMGSSKKEFNEHFNKILKLLSV